MRFELPDTAPSMKEAVEYWDEGEHRVIRVNLDSEFAKLFFGANFVSLYRDYTKRNLK